MARLCGRPGCSEVGVVAYGMVPEDLLFWISPLADAPIDRPNVLCARHADAMVVPRGWTLDDRREHSLRLFKPRPIERPAPRPRRANRRPPGGDRPEQLQIDGTGEIARPPIDDEVDESAASPAKDVIGAPADTSGAPDVAAPPWRPDFDHDDDLDGLLEVNSPLLARAFRGTGRPRP